MATEVKRRRGTTSEHSSFTGAVAETTVDLDKDTVVVHDGSTAGGFPLLREDFNNAIWTTPDSRYLLESNNLSDLDSAATARGNLGLANGSADLDLNSLDINGSSFVDSSRNVSAGTVTTTRVDFLSSNGTGFYAWPNNTLGSETANFIGTYAGGDGHLPVIIRHSSNNVARFDFINGIEFRVDTTIDETLTINSQLLFTQGNEQLLSTDASPDFTALNINGSTFVDSSRNVSARNVDVENNLYFGGGVSNNGDNKDVYAGFNANNDGRLFIAPRTNASPDFSREFGYDWNDNAWYAERQFDVRGDATIDDTLTINSQQLFTLGNEQLLSTDASPTFAGLTSTNGATIEGGTLSWKLDTEHEIIFSNPNAETGIAFDANGLGNRSRFDMKNFASATTSDRSFQMGFFAVGSNTLVIKYTGEVAINGQNIYTAGQEQLLSEDASPTFGNEVTIDSTGTAKFIPDRASNTDESVIQHRTAGSNRWTHGLRGTGDANYHFYSHSLNGDAVRIDYTTGDLNALYDLNVSGTATLATAQIGTLRTTLFKPQSINGMGGEFAFTAVSKVVSISESTTTTGTIVVEDAVFSDNDLVIVSSGFYDASGFVKVELEFTSTGSSVSGGTQYSYTSNSGDPTDIEAGFTILRAGNNTTPTDLIYVDATEGGDSPSIKAYEDISSFSDSPLSGGNATPLWELGASKFRFDTPDTVLDSTTGLEFEVGGSASSEEAKTIKWLDSGNLRSGIYSTAGGALSLVGYDGTNPVVGALIDDEFDIQLPIRSVNGAVYLNNLPTSDPSEPGRLWNDSGTVKVSTTSPPSTPSAPTNVSLCKEDNPPFAQYLRLDWDASAGADEYDVFRGTSSGSLTYLTTTSITQYDDTTPAQTANQSTTYYYHVKARNESGSSPASTEVSDSFNTATAC